MKIELYVVGPVQTNCYFIINESNNEMIILDPGASAAALAKKIEEAGYQPKAILITHGHFDHAAAAEELAKHFAIPVYAHEAERETMEKPSVNLSSTMGEAQSYPVDVYVKDEQELDLAGMHIRVLFTPGHTAGGCCYYFPYEDALFCGDTLFYGSVGRTDFPGGSMSTLVRAIREKLMVLPENTVCFPGHGDSTTIDDERMNNPYL